MIDSYGLIDNIFAEKGNVVIQFSDRGYTRTNTMTVDEALDRSEAIKSMTTENEVRHGQTVELADWLLRAAAEARSQQAKMIKNGEFVDFRIKEKNLRMLELSRANGGRI